MPDNFPAGQIEHPAQGIVVGEAGLVFCDLAELTVQALNDIRRVYDFPNLGGICEKGTQNIPVWFDTDGFPSPCNGWHPEIRTDTPSPAAGSATP